MGLKDLPRCLWSRGWLDVALVIVLSVLVHKDALGVLEPTEFTFDDTAIVRDNPRLRVEGWDGISALITSKYWGEKYQSERLWRPVPMLSFALDRWLHGPDADRYRWTNVGLHALVCVCVLLLFRRLLRRRDLAIAGALLFALHPVHAEATSGVVGRCEVLALLGAIAGILFHLRAREATSPARAFVLFVLAACCFLIGFLSKEIALTGPFILAVVELAQRRPPVERPFARIQLGTLPPYAIYVFALGVYFSLRSEVLGDIFPKHGAQTIGVLPFEVRLLVGMETIRDFWWAMLWPQLTSAHYPFQPPEWTLGPGVVATAGLHVVLLSAGAAALWRRGSTRSRSLGLGIYGFYLSLGPVSNILVPIGVVQADRLLYTPSLWGCLAMAAGLGLALERIPSARGRRGALILLLALVLGGYNLRLAGNVRAWTNSERLWRTTLKRFPDDNPRAHLNLALSLLSRVSTSPGVEEEARQHLIEAIRGFQPNRPGWPRLAAKARCGLAGLVQAEDLDRAEALFLEARWIDENSEQASLGLVDVYLTRADQERNAARKLRYLRLAEREAQRGANQVAPHSYHLWLTLGSTLTRLTGREADAESALTQAIRRHPDPWQAHFNRGRLRNDQKDHEGALDDFRHVNRILVGRMAITGGRLRPEEWALFPEALLFHGFLAYRLEYFDEAQLALERLRQWFPDSKENKKAQAYFRAVRRKRG